MGKYITVWKDTCCYRQSEADSHYTLLKKRRQEGKMASRVFSLSAAVQPIWPPGTIWALLGGGWTNTTTPLCHYLIFFYLCSCMSTEYSRGLVVLEARAEVGTDLQTKDILVQKQNHVTNSHCSKQLILN